MTTRVSIKFKRSGEYLIQEYGYGARIIVVRKGQQMTFSLPVTVEECSSLPLRGVQE